MSARANDAIIDDEPSLLRKIASYNSSLMLIVVGLFLCAVSGCGSLPNGEAVDLNVTDRLSDEAVQPQEEAEDQVTIEVKRNKSRRKRLQEEGGQRKDADRAEGDKEGRATANSKAYIDETVLADGYDIKVTAKGYEEGTEDGSTIKVLLENQSETDYIIGAACAVNGYMMSDYYVEEVPAGKKKNADILFRQSELTKYGI